MKYENNHRKRTQKKQDFFLSLLQEFGYKSKVLSEDDKEDMAIGKWINEGMKTEDDSEEVVFDTLRKHEVTPN